ncbi:tetratricopeptide repeat protein [Aerosakkonemataceae cyanobacterium BLCC-F50]|uniref:Tetratricopeptide repeat protein n=1 Tax=Floridaenema flaviceps BLCC-F50 TaxID=3153642 RepID=A0ABV4Y0H2_9CYAN
MQSFTLLLKWLNREKITLLISFLLLLFGAVYPWYRLPKEALETFGSNLFLANVMRFLPASLALISFTFTIFFGINRVPRWLFWVGLMTVLLFPYSMVTSSPTVNFLAKSYYNQGEKTSLHVERNFPEVQAQWKQNISLEKAIAVPSTFDISIPDSRFFQLPSWESVLVRWFGYSDSFFQFIGRGWGFTVIGLTVGLFGFYLGLKSNKIDILLEDMIQLLPGFGLVLAAIVVFSISINVVNYRLDTMFAKGEYAKVLATSQTLASWYPTLQGDETFLQRWAEAGFYNNQPDTALLDFVKGLELYRSNDFPTAADYFKKSLSTQNRFLVRGYLASAILNQGVNYFNERSSKKPGTAADLFEKVLQIFPSNVEALYDLMLARVVSGEWQQSAAVAQNLIDTQQYFQQPKLGLIAQAYVHSTWEKYHEDNVVEAWKRYRQSIDPKTWKKKEAEQ